MASARINGRQVEVVVLAADNTTPEEGLDPHELSVVTEADTAIAASPRFLTAHPAPRLERVESNRGLDDGEHGRYYLRYRRSDGSASEWWARIGKRASLNEKQGLVTVAQPEAKQA